MFEPKDFEWESFVEAISTRLFSIEQARSDTHVKYLFGYLGDPEINARSIIVETDYVDGDFLEDFASFYVRCFEPYERFCKRLHFFSMKLSRQDFDALASSNASSELIADVKKHYLGFIVVKPLPDAIIGRTQLKTYGPDGGRRNYTALVRYEAHIFGIDLAVESLAFQEQDRAVAACATVALWSCFQKTSRLFGTPAPRPPKITLDATQSIYDQRALPSNGLYVEQICNAIRLNGLDPEVFGQSARERLPIASLIYAHLKGGLPVLLVVEVEGLEGHALALSGFSLRDTPQLKIETANPPKEAPQLVGLRIDEFYAHDDQHGPFSRLRVLAPHKGKPVAFEGSWQHSNGKKRKLLLRQIIIPVYHKIRLNFITVYDRLRRRIHPLVLTAASITGHDLLEWDVYLTTTNDYKKAICEERLLNGGRLTQILGSQQPRFFWRCLVRSKGMPLLEFLIDATSFMRSRAVWRINFLDENFANSFVQVSSVSDDKDLAATIAEEYDQRNGPRVKEMPEHPLSLDLSLTLEDEN